MGLLLRREAGITVSEWRYGQIAIVCVAAHERPHRGVAHERFLPAGPFAILPMCDAGPDNPGAVHGPHRSSTVRSARAEVATRLMKLDPRAFRPDERRVGPECVSAGQYWW